MHPHTQPAPAAIDPEELPPTQYLILEVLAARYRTGEVAWTFPARFRSHVEQLADIGLIGWKSGVVPRTVLAWLTEVGRKSATSDTYVAPNERGERP